MTRDTEDYVWHHERKLEKKRVKQLTSLKLMRQEINKLAMEGGTFRLTQNEEVGYLICDGAIIYSWECLDPELPLGFITKSDALQVIAKTWVNGRREGL